MFLKCKIQRHLTRQSAVQEIRSFSNNFRQVKTFTTSNEKFNHIEVPTKKFSFRSTVSDLQPQELNTTKNLNRIEVPTNKFSFRNTKFKYLQSQESEITPTTGTENKKFTLSTEKLLERKNTVVIHNISNIYPTASVLESLKTVELFKNINIVQNFETDGHNSDHYSLNLVLENNENAPKEQCAWYIAKEFGKENDFSFDGKTILVATHKENLTYRQVFMPALPGDFTVEKLIKLDSAFEEAVSISLKDGKSKNKIATVEFRNEFKAKDISKKEIILEKKPLKMVINERVTGKWNSSLQ